MVFVLIEKVRGSNVKVPHLACKVWVRCLFSLLSNVPHVACNVWVGSLFSLLSNVPHVACNVWVRSSYSLVVCLERDLCLSYTLHTLTFSMRTNSVLTPCKQGAVLSRYSDSLGTFTLLPWPLTTLTWVVTRNVKNAGQQNKCILTFRFSTSATVASIYPRDFPTSVIEIPTSQIDFTTSQIETTDIQ